MHLKKVKHHFLTAKKRWFLVCVILLSLAVGIAARPSLPPKTTNYARLVTVHADGVSRTIATNEPTVKQAVAKFGISLSSKDKTEPSLETRIRGADFTINLYRARPVTVVDGANTYTITTAERSPKTIAQKAGFVTNSEDEFNFQRSDDPFAGAPGTQMVIQRSKSIFLDLYGVTKPTNTHETTVGDFLQDRNLKLDPGDELNLPRQARITDGMTISIAQVGRTVETIEEPAAFEEERINDAQQPTSYKKIQTPGKNGKKLVTYETVTRNGGAPTRSVIKEVITEAPVKQVVIVGAKSNTFGGDFGAALAKLRSCEGSYTSNTGNGYYGAYQFNVGTWRSNAPAAYKDVLPSNAPPAAQDEAAATLYRARGWQPWPGCTKKLGLQDIYR